MQADKKSINSTRRQSILQLIAGLLILVSINIISSYLFTRIDLTSENRYSLSPSSKKLASELKDVVFFKVYLAGELPPGFRKLRNATREMLEEFKVYAGNNIEYEFIDPSADPNEKERVNIYKQLNEKGLIPTQLEEREKGARSQLLLFPGAIVSMGSKETPVQLLKTKIGSNPEVMLNNSIENLEFEIASTLRKLSTPIVTKVAFLQGHGESGTRKISDFARSLGEFYQVDTLSIRGRLDALTEYKTLIIARPDTSFSEKDKFIIDQFIMNGGRVLWLLDKMQIHMDSLSSNSTTIAMPYDLNLDDQLFHYGVRVNDDLIMDLQAAPIPIVTGYVGNKPKQELFPWYYFPLMSSNNNHPIVNNLNAIKAEFISSVDTVSVEGIKKTVLLTTSRLSRIQMPPARVSLNILQEEPQPSNFNKAFIPVAVLLEGNFKSNFTNRIPTAVQNAPEIGFKSAGKESKMIIVGDGDIASSFVSKSGTIFPLGYDRYTQQNYGNKNFLLNCVDYLSDDSGIIELRGKELKLRMLDAEKKKSWSFINWLNVIVPALLILIYGIFRHYRRKKRFSN